MITITHVHLERAHRASHVQATGYIVLDHEWRINGVRVVRNTAGRLLVSLPHRQSGGRLDDYLHPVNPGARQRLDAAVLAAYEKLVAGEAS